MLNECAWARTFADVPSSPPGVLEVHAHEKADAPASLAPRMPPGGAEGPTPSGPTMANVAKASCHCAPRSQARAAALYAAASGRAAPPRLRASKPTAVAGPMTPKILLSRCKAWCAPPGIRGIGNSQVAGSGRRIATSTAAASAQRRRRPKLTMAPHAPLGPRKPSTHKKRGGVAGVQGIGLHRSKTLSGTATARASS